MLAEIVRILLEISICTYLYRVRGGCRETFSQVGRKLKQGAGVSIGKRKKKV